MLEQSSAGKGAEQHFLNKRAALRHVAGRAGRSILPPQIGIAIVFRDALLGDKAKNRLSFRLLRQAQQRFFEPVLIAMTNESYRSPIPNGFWNADSRGDYRNTRRDSLQH